MLMLSPMEHYMLATTEDTEEEEDNDAAGEEGCWRS